MPETGHPPYVVATDGRRLSIPSDAGSVPRGGRSRVSVGDSHAVPAWSPARTLCGRLTARMAVWPDRAFDGTRASSCRPCGSLAAARSQAVEPFRH